jgi:hypothetical protein
MHRLTPFFQYFLASTENQIDKRIFTDKRLFIFRVFTNLPIKSFHNSTSFKKLVKRFW